MTPWMKGLFETPGEARVQLGLIAAILLVINILTFDSGLRVDLTDDGRYTLSETSREIATDLSDPLHITAYFSDDLPPDFERAKREFGHLVSDLRRASGNSITYQVKDPSGDDELREEAGRAGIQSVRLDVREGDRMVQQQAFMGITMEYGEEMEVMPFMQPGMPMEYEIVSALERMMNPYRPIIGFTHGRGEAGRDEMAQFTNQLQYRYRLRQLEAIEEGIPEEIDILAVMAPRQAYSASELQSIRAYLQKGGSVFMALNRVEVEPHAGEASVFDTGLEDLLAAYGISVDTTLIRDRNSSAVRVPGQAGQYGYANRVDYPYIPIIQDFAEHPITGGLSGVVFQFLSPVRKTSSGPEGITLTELARSSEESGLTEEEYNVDPMQQWSGADFLESYIPAAIAARGNFNPGETSDPVQEGSLVVIGDGNFLMNTGSGGEQELPADNINLAINAFDWLADDTGLIELRTKITHRRPIRNLEGQQQRWIAYGNVLLPILFISLIGMSRFWYTRALIRKRKQIRERYE